MRHKNSETVSGSLDSMSPLYDFINDQYQVWDTCIFVDTAALDVTEIWTNPTSGFRAVENKRLSTLDVDSSLQETATKTIDGTEYSLVLRLVWIKFQHVEKIKHIAPAVLDRLLARFRIEIAHRWNWTCFAGSTRFEEESQGGPLYSYAVCNHPKVAAAWSHSPGQGITQGIYFAGPSQLPELQNLVRSLAGVANHPMLPALVFGISLSGLIEKEHKTIKENVRAVEVRTRFHSWTSRNEAPAEGDYISLSSATTGAKTRLANLLRRTKIVHELCDFIYDNLQPPSTHGSHVGKPVQLPTSDPINLTEEYTRVLYKRTVLQSADVQFFQSRADAQVAALSIMIAQDQAATNINIASAMQQDSLSLKTLSLVTMFFLPGTFLATLFSVPILAWGDGKLGENRFWIYWVFAIPLTLMTFGTWWVWTSILEKRVRSAAGQDKGKYKEI